MVQLDSADDDKRLARTGLALMDFTGRAVIGFGWVDEEARRETEELG